MKIRLIALLLFCLTLVSGHAADIPTAVFRQFTLGTNVVVTGSNALASATTFTNTVSGSELTLKYSYPGVSLTAGWTLANSTSTNAQSATFYYETAVQNDAGTWLWDNWQNSPIKIVLDANGTNAVQKTLWFSLYGRQRIRCRVIDNQTGGALTNYYSIIDLPTIPQ